LNRRQPAIGGYKLPVGVGRNDKSNGHGKSCTSETGEICTLTACEFESRFRGCERDYNGHVDIIAQKSSLCRATFRNAVIAISPKWANANAMIKFDADFSSQITV
jgi:hypothetical protein